MAATAVNFAIRRRRAIGMVTAAAVALLAAYALRRLTLGATSFPSGWILLVSMLILAAYNLRKKLPFLPLGSASAWTQFHLYLGLLSILMFLIHVGFRVPNGALEGTLAALFLLVAGSGIAGLALSRILPPRLTRRGEQVLFERIPAFRVRLRERLEELIVRSAKETGSAILADFCTRRVLPHFERPEPAWRHLLEVGRPRHLLLAQMEDFERFLNGKERAIRSEVTELILVKDDLDYQRAAQGILKAWLFVHVPLTWALLILAAWHGTLAYRYAMNLP